MLLSERAPVVHRCLITSSAFAVHLWVGSSLFLVDHSGRVGRVVATRVRSVTLSEARRDADIPSFARGTPLGAKLRGSYASARMLHVDS